MVYRSKCDDTVPSDGQGLRVRWTNLSTFATVQGILDAQGQAVFTRSQITPGQEWLVQIQAESACSEGIPRRGCWDGTITNWGNLEPEGQIRLYSECPSGCASIPAPPDSDMRWGNASGCPGL